MGAKSSVFIATSLDGFISRVDGSIDWLEQANLVVPEGEDCGYKAFISTVDALVMGRNTFEQVLTFDGWPYAKLPVVVLSHKQIAIPTVIKDTVMVSQESPIEIVTRLLAKGIQHIYVDGGRTIQSFFAADLIDEITITVIPILLGTGRPLFGPLPHDIHLTHIQSMSYEFGFVQHRYRVARETNL
ncbi:MAG: dihydrofolate reductase [Cyanobacteria bacterium CRU_2_1]|nr:dihydrofolate reductase [Cyanobacteria bacterium CRU_2_1]